MSKREVWERLCEEFRAWLLSDGENHGETRLTYERNRALCWIQSEALAVLERLESTQPTERDGEWVSMVEPDGTFAVDEGQTYLFAIEVSCNAGPPSWEYFVDAVVWDAETDPDWSSGEHGWDISDEILFRPIAPPQPKGTK